LASENGLAKPDVSRNFESSARRNRRDAGFDGGSKQGGEVSLLLIGRVLAHSPHDPDGAWPPSAVRDIIEEIANPRLDDEFACQVSNNRGFTSRGLTDGGVQERELVEKYERDAEQIADIWPRTASVLRGIAQGCRRRAEREDSSADLTQDLWG